LVDFELSSAADFSPSPLECAGAAERTVSLVNNGNPFKYSVASADFSSPLCDYAHLEANLNGGAPEYSGALKDFYLSPFEYSSATDWVFKLTLASNTPSSLDGATCGFKFVFFGSQVRHGLALGGGFYDREEIENSLTAQTKCQECFIYGATSSAPVRAALDNGTVVTGKVAKYDSLYATQSVSGTKYIYLDWAFPGLPAGASTTLALLTLAHQEVDVTMSVEWWNGLAWAFACPMVNSPTEIISTCDLKPVISTTDKAKDVKLRLKLVQGNSCHESLNWANLEISYEQEVPCEVCGNGLLEAGDPSTGSGQEECDDGNLVDGDGCGADCRIGCAAGPEICDGVDNDCDNIIDNVYGSFKATGTPLEARLNSGTLVTAKTAASDNQYASQSVSGEKYIYLAWHFDGFYPDVEVGTSTLKLEHRESGATMAVEGWDGSAYTAVCDPFEYGSDTVSACDLSAFINTPAKAKDVNLRLRLAQSGGGSGREKLDWAYLEINYRTRVYCEPECGNWRLEADDPSASFGAAQDEGSGQEQCDDGNTLDGDGCGAECRLEDSHCLKINEVYYNAGTHYKSNCQCENDPQDEWIELYNTCDYSINIKDWYLEDNYGQEALNHNYPVAGKQFVVIAANAATWGFWPDIPANAFKIALGHAKLFDGLNNGGDRVFLYDSTGNLADSVSWGSDITAFDPPAALVAPGHSISRQEKGVDTDTAADWMDTYGGSTPPGPNPGTNPHDAAGNLIMPAGSFLNDEDGEEGGEEAVMSAVDCGQAEEEAAPEMAADSPAEIADILPADLTGSGNGNSALTDEAGGNNESAANAESDGAATVGSTENPAVGEGTDNLEIPGEVVVIDNAESGSVAVDSGAETAAGEDNTLPPDSASANDDPALTPKEPVAPTDETQSPDSENTAPAADDEPATDPTASSEAAPAPAPVETSE
jgi:cysteine-rich repeat protein